MIVTYTCPKCSKKYTKLAIKNDYTCPTCQTILVKTASNVSEETLVTSESLTIADDAIFNTYSAGQTVGHLV